VCGRKLDDHAYVPEMGGTYRDDNYYECLVHGPIDKEFVDGVIKHIAELDKQLAEYRAIARGLITDTQDSWARERLIVLALQESNRE